MDVSSLRAQVKSWERAFRAHHRRDPTVDDIKDDPEITQKYKLYKKLTKAANLLTKSRPIHPTPPLSTFNPFSPRKDKQVTASSKPQLRARSPDPFPLLLLPSTSALPPPSPSPAPSSAISRARKRLRGEPVSPSPNKGKRRRIGSHTLPPLPRLNPHLSDGDDDDSPERTSFVDDSPVKAPQGGKSFKLLFEETTAPLPALAIKPKGVSRTESSGGLFMAANTDDDVPWVLGSVSVRPVDELPRSLKRVKRDPPADAHMSTKRALSDVDVAPITTHNPSLLPPSPPPAHSSYRTSSKHSVKGKGKAKPTDKEDGDEDGETDSFENNNVRRVDRTRFRRAAVAEVDDLGPDPDPILRYSRRVTPHGLRSPSPPSAASASREGGTFEVDLPDKLRRMLALETTDTKAQHSREERLLEGLMYGRRAIRYDPNKGGEIWDVGEDDVRRIGEEDTRQDTEGEDDWEGEPVPWEVGEL